MNRGAFARHGVTLKREFSPFRHYGVDKHKVLQILVNLERNAKYACDASGRTDKKVIVRIAKAGDAVQIQVIDNGVGISLRAYGTAVHPRLYDEKGRPPDSAHSGAYSPLGRSAAPSRYAVKESAAARLLLSYCP